MGLVFGFRNDALRDDVTSFTATSEQTDFPASNMLERALAKKYKLEITEADIDIVCQWTDPGFGNDDLLPDIQFIALLNHNLPPTDIRVQLENRNGLNVFDDTFTMNFIPAENTNFPANTFIILDSVQNNIEKATITLDRTDTTFYSIGTEIGGFWIGSIWQPSSDGAGVEMATFSQAIADNSSPQSSRGNSWKSDNLRRVRVNNISIPAMTETEAIGNSSGVVNLQDILFEVGSSQQCIIIPSTSSDHVIHKFGLYGHLTGESRISLVTRSDGTRLYRTDLTHYEEN